MDEIRTTDSCTQANPVLPFHHFSRSSILFPLERFGRHGYSLAGGSSMRRRVVVFLLVGFAAVGTACGVIEYRRWRRFVVVQPGVLYRSNLLPDSQLADVLTRHHIKTVFSLSFTRSDE